MYETILTRRSIRKFHDTPINRDIIERIIIAGMHSPSAMNTRPWCFLVLTQYEKRQIIANMSPYAKPAERAPVVILTLADLLREKDEGWLAQDLAACTQSLLLGIVEEGLGGVWLGIYPNQDRIKLLRQAFTLPENLLPFSAIAFGYSEKDNRPANRFEPNRIFFEGYKD